MTACTHSTTRETWVEESKDDWGTVTPGHWDREIVSSTEDIDTGRYRCTQCNKVMYYTGRWRAYWEDGKPL